MRPTLQISAFAILSAFGTVAGSLAAEEISTPAMPPAPPIRTADGLTVSTLGKLEGLAAGDDAAGNATKQSRIKQRLGDDADAIIVAQYAANLGGNTSIRAASPLVWKEQGYFQRHRDLGQTFTAPQDLRLAAIVLRTGPGEIAYLGGSAGAPVFVQLFAIEGTPVLDDNNTPPGTHATHGFSTNHRCDDFVTGVTYRPIAVFQGGRLPEPVGDGKLVYLKWTLPDDATLDLEKGQRYAFLVGFSEPDAERGITFANHNEASNPAPPRISGPEDRYEGGWGIRREGNGHLPPTMVPGDAPPTDPEIREQLEAESQFPEGDARYAIPPTCDGYPDVDTYRDFEFYLLKRKT